MRTSTVNWVGRRLPALTLVAATAFLGNYSAYGQCADATNDGTCADASSDTCDPNLNHGNGARIGPGATCVGETLRMTGEWFWGDSFLDAWRATDGTLTVGGVPQGTQPITLISGNAVCTGGAACTGTLPNAGCTFPCLIGPPGCACSAGGLNLPGAPTSGLVRIRGDNYVVQAGDNGKVATFTFPSQSFSTCAGAPFSQLASNSANIIVPNCDDGLNCTIDCCAAGVCSNNISTCEGTTCLDVNGDVTTFPPQVCDDSNLCTTDACDGDEPTCCEFTPIACPTPDVCHRQGACIPASGCPPQTSVCDDPTFSCDDNNDCTTDTCDDTALGTGCCVHTPILCPTPDACHNQPACEPDGGCPPVTSKCDDPTFSCDDNNDCTTDTCDDTALGTGCCVHTPITCPTPDVCHRQGACEADGGCPPQTSVCDDPTFSCDDNDDCTTDSCDASATGTGCCVHTPIECPTPDVCHRQGDCDADGGCPPQTSVCDDPTFSCDDDNECTTDTCDATATGTGCCEHENIPCEPPPACFTRGPCNPASGCPPVVSVCDDPNFCGAGFKCDETAPGCCVEEVLETCRTPGFWGTHACGSNGTTCEKNKSRNLTGLALAACGGCVEVCGDIIDTTVLNDSDSALEAICVSPQGTQVRQLARQLTSAALNCCISALPGSCDGSSISAEFAACNAACAAGNTSTTVNGNQINCIQVIDDFNNGRISDCHERNVGTCGNGAICTEQLPCAVGNCGAPGPAGSSNACNSAKGNSCYVIGTTDCAGSDDSNASQSCP